MSGNLFSMAAPSPSLDTLRQKLGTLLSRSEPSSEHSLALSWAELDALLPDGGLPHGVVELAAPHALGGATMVALAAVRAGQSRDARAWCAWIDSTGTLYAPGAAMAGVDLHRLFVVRPPRSEAGRVAVKVARSQAFAVIVVDGDPVFGAVTDDERGRVARSRHDRSREVLVRKLALFAAQGGATVILLTDARRAYPAPLPVALRLELVRAPESIHVRIGKDRFGRGGLAKTVPLRSRPSLLLAG
ncbi:MAG: recombinase A [Polyangiaceae bacterium]